MFVSANKVKYTSYVANLSGFYRWHVTIYLFLINFLSISIADWILFFCTSVIDCRQNVHLALLKSWYIWWVCFYHTLFLTILQKSQITKFICSQTKRWNVDSLIILISHQLVWYFVICISFCISFFFLCIVSLNITFFVKRWIVWSRKSIWNVYTHIKRVNNMADNWTMFCRDLFCMLHNVLSDSCFSFLCRLCLFVHLYPYPLFVCFKVKEIWFVNVSCINIHYREREKW